VGCDNAVPDVLQSNTRDKVATTDGTAKPNDDRIRCLPNLDENVIPTAKSCITTFQYRQFEWCRIV
jgi:hypothetical protein